jgi:hypothetical protein
VKPENIAVGQSGASILTVYLAHPRDPVASVSRRITRVDLELFRIDGTSLGIVDSHTFQ